MVDIASVYVYLGGQSLGIHNLYDCSVGVFKNKHAILMFPRSQVHLMYKYPHGGWEWKKILQ